MEQHISEELYSMFDFAIGMSERAKVYPKIVSYEHNVRMDRRIVYFNLPVDVIKPNSVGY